MCTKLASIVTIAYDFEDVLEDSESYKLDSGFYTFIIMFLLFVDEFFVSNFFSILFFFSEITTESQKQIQFLPSE